MQPLWVIFLVFAVCGIANSQELPERCIWVKELNVPVQIDSLTIVPSSLTTQSKYVTLTYSASSSTLTISTERYIDSVQVCYQVFPFAFNKTYRRRIPGSINDTTLQDTVVTQLPTYQREEIFTSEAIQKNGTISRGVSFGNNQDVFVNSTLNLNLEGKLTDDLNIRAAITDQNIPFQPEGNTQQLQDFDNVYVELYNDNVSLTAGDIVLRQQPSHFLRYYKNVQGGLGRVNYSIGESTATSQLGISVAKGQFESTLIPAKEGVLGPYRIPGPEGQPYVIILANSERVFLDDRQLERGFNRDYTIDYNQAQITFTNRILITEFSRIRIDYEYSDQNYSRSIIAGSHQQQIGRFNLQAQYYKEGDNRNRPLFGDLSLEEKQLMSNIGDDLSLSITSGADSVEFSADELLYARRDTMVNDTPVQIYQYSADKAEAHYRVSFTEVGQNKGNYALDRITANGRIYVWVAPENGVPQGSFIPYIRLPVPNKRQMFTLGGTFDINEYEKAFVETAISDHDNNLFSEADSHDDQGMAMKAGFTSNGRKVSFLDGYTWQSQVSFEYDTRYFRGIDRFRSIEFNRNWNVDQVSDTLAQEEKIAMAGVGIFKNTDSQISYDIRYRNREGIVHGVQQELIVNQHWNKLYLKSRLYSMRNSATTTDARWNQVSTDISRRGLKFVPGYLFTLDKDKWRLNEKDTSVMHYSAHTLYMHQGEESKWQYDVRYTYREDDRPLEGLIKEYSTSHTGRFQLGRTFKNQRIQAILTYRNQEITGRQQHEESISSRIEWRGSWFDNHLRAELTYAVSNSQELRREYVYVKVPAGEGTHTWRDLNDDGIQDLNEFFLAINVDERNYAKIFVPTSEFVTAFQNLLIAQMQVDFPSEWKEVGGIRAFLSRFSNNTSWTSDTKIDSENLGDKLFAFARDVDDVLSDRNLLRSTTFFNRTSSVYGMEFNFQAGKRQQLLTSGFEGVDNRFYTLTLRISPVRQYNLKLIGSTGNKESYSDYLPDRNYRVETHRINPQLNWQPGRNFRATIQYAYQQRISPMDELQESYSRSNELQFDLRFSKAISSVFNANVKLLNIDFSGEKNTPVGYELLNALQPGKNVVWNVNWQQRITRGLQINLRYDGRASENARVIHTGRVQVSALF